MRKGLHKTVYHALMTDEDTWFEKKIYGIPKQRGSYVGGDTEKRVYKNPDAPGRVIKIYKEQLYRPSKQAMRTYYHLHRIVHFLFPDKVPHVNKTTFKPGSIDQDFVEGISDASQSERDYVASLLKSAGLGIEHKSDNYIRDPEDSIHYIDDLSITEQFMQNLEVMVRTRLEGHDLRSALASLERIRAIHKEPVEPRNPDGTTAG